MNTKEKKYLDKILNGTLPLNEKRNQLLFLLFLFLIGWSAGFLDYSNFFSDVPALILMGIYLFIITIPLIAVFQTFHIATGNKENYIENFVIITAHVLKKLSISYALIYLIYVAAYTFLKESSNIVFYDVQYYFVTIISLIYSIIFLTKINTYFKYLYGNEK